MIKEILINKMNYAFVNNEGKMRGIIESFSKTKKRLKVLDVGCGSGEMTLKILDSVKDKVDIYGIDGLQIEKNESIRFTRCDLEGKKIPFNDNVFDVVFSNQVIEHILDKDNFVSEIHRVLKNDGLYIISTENISSFDNIISLMFGQEPISQHTGSKYHTNSFLSPHFMRTVENGNKYLHKNVCSYFGLLRIAKLNGFKDPNIYSLGNINGVFERLFPIYNRIITIYGTK